ncbi:serine hydrolase [Streptomyces sp. PT12]|uniref:serine hydrolase domain-containing protein n=1 Tax=Streptomyces sp. PT12 TaxID=1510197 RepID=UPI000DE2AD1F|nr:serine hydrolase domain-containing protein [Streptomyces sp. PT12]RBM08085.1 serine hydrolase [Streptomyces sp. PT12]
MRAATALDELVERAAERLGRGRPGALAVAAVREGECAFHGADPRAVFEIGSLSKTFTSLALARLAVRGEVALDLPVRELLPAGTRVPERGGRAIELGHLACHTSGLPKLPKGMLPRALLPGPDPYAGYTREKVLDGLARTRLRSAPGERFHYSNVGVGLLGLALAEHTGLDYEALVRAEVCDPLGLADTRVRLDDERVARLAPGHSRTGRRVPRWHTAALAPAAGLHSTASDLLSFAMAQLGDAPGPLAAAMALTRASGHPLGGKATAHPGWIGLRLLGGGGDDTLMHNGGTGGYRSLLALTPERQTAVVILSANPHPTTRTGLGLLAELSRR